MPRWSTCEECENVIQRFQLSDRKGGRVVVMVNLTQLIYLMGQLRGEGKSSSLSLFLQNILSSADDFTPIQVIYSCSNCSKIAVIPASQVRVSQSQSRIVYVRYEQLDLI